MEEFTAGIIALLEELSETLIVRQQFHETLEFERQEKEKAFDIANKQRKAMQDMTAWQLGHAQELRDIQSDVEIRTKIQVR